MWLAIAIFGLLIVGTAFLNLRQKRLNQQSRWSWWREIHERLRRYPTPEEVEEWESEQAGPAAEQ